MHSPLIADRLLVPAQPRTRMLNWACVVLALVWLGLVSLTLVPEIDDSKQYWQAARNLHLAGNPFTAPPGQEATSYTGYYYPPLFAYLTRPLALLDQSTAQIAWYWLNTLALGGFITICLVQCGSHTARCYWGVLVLVFSLLPPTRLTLQLGQISLLTSLLLVGGFVLAGRRPWLAGLLFALSVHFRIYPAMLALAFAQRRQWKLLVAWISAGLGLVAIPALFYGLDHYVSFLHAVVGSDSYPFAAEHNISFYGFFARLLAASRYTAAPLAVLPGLVGPFAGLCSLGAIGLCLLAGRGGRSDGATRLHFSMWLCAMLLVSTTNGYYSLVLLLFPLLTVMAALEQQPDRRLLGATALTTMLLAVPPGWSRALPPLDQFVHSGWGIALLTPSLGGLVLLLGILILLVRRSTHQSLEHRS